MVSNVIVVRYVVIIIPSYEKTSKPDSLKRKALQFYLEGLGFRSIGRFLGISHVSVCQWIKQFGAKLRPIKRSGNYAHVKKKQSIKYD